MDDDQAFREVMKEILDVLGYVSVFVKDGEETLKYYKKAKDQNNTIDAVIMDLKIDKGINGEEGAKRLLEFDPKAKIIISSGFSHHPIMQKPKDFGIQAVLLKPFDLPALQKILERILKD